MDINWYPGHMKASIRMIESNIKLVDTVIYVLDSRAPKSCINPDFAPLIKHLPIIYVLNKVDLVPQAYADKWLSFFCSDSSAAILLNSTSSKVSAVLPPLIKKLCKDKLDRYHSKGVSVPLRAMVIGVPNCGKSTLVNSLCGHARAATGNKPGVTRGKQWVKVSDYLEVLDTPGTLYPKLSEHLVAENLAILGSIRDEVVDSVELAEKLLTRLITIAPVELATRYKLNSASDIDLRALAQSRGMLMKGNIPDTDRMASAVLDDYRKCRFGKIALESI